MKFFYVYFNRQKGRNGIVQVFYKTFTTQSENAIEGRDFDSTEDSIRFQESEVS